MINIFKKRKYLSWTEYQKKMDTLDCIGFKAKCGKVWFK